MKSGRYYIKSIMHPAWKTVEEIGEFLSAMNAPKDHHAANRFGDALEACEALVSAYKGGEHSGSIDWSDLDHAHKLALKVVESEEE